MIRQSLSKTNIRKGNNEKNWEFLLETLSNHWIINYIADCMA